MTKIIRRRIIPRGVLPPTTAVAEPMDGLLPPSQVFRGEEADHQMEEHMDGLDELPIRPPMNPVEMMDADSSELYPPVGKIKKPSKVVIITEEDEEDTQHKYSAGMNFDADEEEPPYDKEPVKVDKRFKARKVGKNPIEDIMLAMREGEAVVIKREGLTSYAVSLVPNDILISKSGNKFKKGITGKQYWEEVLNPEFVKWSKTWNAMTYTEKVATAEKQGLVWDRSDNPKLDVMNLTEVARIASGIEKYKPEYVKRSARSKIRG